LGNNVVTSTIHPPTNSSEHDRVQPTEGENGGMKGGGDNCPDEKYKFKITKK
jgi:hypothetical protein